MKKFFEQIGAIIVLGLAILIIICISIARKRGF